MPDDQFKLERFVEAQDPKYARVLNELRRGRKVSHWMWYMFPQIAGLGMTAMSKTYSISGLDEARAYLDHALLGSRLRECTELVNAVEDRSIQAIFGHPDYLKFRSCMTLFARAADDNEVFVKALEKYFDGEEDTLTIEKLG